MHEEHADVAQLVEQLIRNQQVNGSSPFVGSIPSPHNFELHGSGAVRSRACKGI
jgi:hypothetical protein